MEVINVAAAHVTMPELAANRLFWVRLAPCPPQSESEGAQRKMAMAFPSLLFERIPA